MMPRLPKQRQKKSARNMNKNQVISTQKISARKNEARIVIEQTRQQMLNEVKNQSERFRRQTEDTLASLRTEAIQQHKQEIADLVAQFAREMMIDLMNPQLQKLYQEEFLDKVKGIDISKFVGTSSHNEEEYIKPSWRLKQIRTSRITFWRS